MAADTHPAAHGARTRRARRSRRLQRRLRSSTHHAICLQESIDGDIVRAEVCRDGCLTDGCLRGARSRPADLTMTDSGRKRCVVAYATRERQYLWAVDVPSDATIAEVLEAARQLADEPDVPWETAPVGIFGELRERSDCPAAGDR